MPDTRRRWPPAGRIVDESDDPAHWTLSDRAGNRVCVTAWPDGFVKEGGR